MVPVSPAAIQESERDQFDVPTSLAVRINGSRNPLIFLPTGDPLRTQFVPLQKLQRIQSVRIEVVERTGGHGAVGFSEIGLILR